MVTQILYSKEFDKHNNEGHPESSERTTVMMKSLQGCSFFDELEMVDPVVLPEKTLREVHSSRMIKQIKDISRSRDSWLDLDTYVCKGDFRTAKLAAGGLVKLCENVMDDRADNGFGVIRPPGHHATSSSSMGFCLFNNEALAAHVMAKKGYRVLVIDPDVHHGNGVQDIFYERDDVLYESLHLSPHFPGTGKVEEVGKGDGEGYTVNVPLSYNTGDEGCFKVLDDIFLPIAREFNPDLVVVASGFDGHHSDRLGGFRLTANFFGDIIPRLQKLQPRIVCALEGGYSLDWIGKCLVSQVGALSGNPVSFEDDVKSRSNVDGVVDKVKDVQSSYWKL